MSKTQTDGQKTVNTDNNSIISVNNVSNEKGLTGSGDLFSDDMESYSVGAFLAASDLSGNWTTWSNLPGSYEDGVITDAESASPTKSCLVDGITDLVLLLGDKTSGKYEVSVDYFIPSGYGGYINLQHFEDPGVEWACQVSFGDVDDPDNGEILAGDPTAIPFTFPHDTWFTINFLIDLDADIAVCHINDIFVAQWQFSLQSYGDPGTLQLGSVNLWAGSLSGDPMYYFDNIEYSEVPPIPISGWALGLGLLLISGFIVVRFRRRLA